MIHLLALGTMLVTGYVCPPYCGTTASGVQVGPGVAACPPDFPFGAQLVIDGVGAVTCADRYSPSLSERIDVFEDTEADAFAITGEHAVWLQLSEGAL